MSDEKRKRLCHFLLIIAGACGVYICFYCNDIMRNRKDNEAYAMLARQTVEKPAEQTGGHGAKPAEEEPDWEAKGGAAGRSQGKKGKLTGKAVLPLPEYIAFYKKNPDFIGWLKIEGTKVNYPVVKGKDNKFYLNHSFEKERNRYGTIFADKDSDLEEPFSQIILYGHNMKDGAMFGVLDQYADPDFYQRHKTIQFENGVRSGEFEIFSVIKTDTENGLPFYNFQQGKGEKDYLDFMEKAIESSIYPIASEGTWEDIILTLSTCDYSQKDGRILVMAGIRR